MIELHRNRNIVSDLNAKCQYFVTTVLNHDFVDESRRESGGELSPQLCADIKYDRDAKHHLLNDESARLMNCEVRREVRCEVTLLEL